MKRAKDTVKRIRNLVGVALLAAGLGGAMVPTAAWAQPAESAESDLPATVNINTADAGALADTLNGIGVSRAEAIVRYREMYGPFDSVEELTDVAGVGAATLERNRDRITLE